MDTIRLEAEGGTKCLDTAIVTTTMGLIAISISMIMAAGTPNLATILMIVTR
jgi:hypothetical protein